MNNPLPKQFRASLRQGAALLALGMVFTGCSTTKQKASPEGAFQPLNVYASAAVLPKQVRRVAMLPVTADETMSFLQELDIPADITVGNKPATVMAKVREGASGADFILFKLPDDVPQGCLVPIAVQAGGVTSNVASVSISSSGGSCCRPRRRKAR